MNGFKKGLESAWNSPSRAVILRYVCKHWLRISLRYLTIHRQNILGRNMLFLSCFFYRPFIGCLLWPISERLGASKTCASNTIGFTIIAS